MEREIEVARGVEQGLARCMLVRSRRSLMYLGCASCKLVDEGTSSILRK
jgi:hypothetical protein